MEQLSLFSIVGGAPAPSLSISYDDALAAYRAVLDRYHVAMLAGDIEAAKLLKDEAGELAYAANGGNPGTLASEDAVGCRLLRDTAAPLGIPPRWGQAGEFILTLSTHRFWVRLRGLIDLGPAGSITFEVRAVDLDKPFISETGFQSFAAVALSVDTFGLEPKDVIGLILRAHHNSLKGKLPLIEAKYRERDEEMPPELLECRSCDRCAKLHGYCTCPPAGTEYPAEDDPQHPGYGATAPAPAPVPAKRKARKVAKGVTA